MNKIKFFKFNVYENTKDERTKKFWQFRKEGNFLHAKLINRFFVVITNTDCTIENRCVKRSSNSRILWLVINRYSNFFVSYISLDVMWHFASILSCITWKLEVIQCTTVKLVIISETNKWQSIPTHVFLNSHEFGLKIRAKIQNFLYFWSLDTSM